MEIELCESFYYRVPSEKLDIYSTFNSSKSNVCRNNEDLDFYAGEWIKIQQNDYASHIVKPAENLSSIAEIYNVTVEKLREDNNLKSNKLFIGQILKIYK